MNTSRPKESVFDISFEEAQQLPKAEVDALTKKVREQNEFSLEETKTRNVLIVGRTRSGKSTAIGVLKDPCYEPKEMTIFSDTVDPKFQSFALDDKTKSTKYTVNIIDTPGLKEVKQMGEDARSDEVILNTINYCLKNEITKINVLLIFISFELGVTKDDLDSFQSFLEKFSHNTIKIAVCITRCEDKTPKWKENIVAQLHQHTYFSQVLQKPNIKVCFMGCVDAVKSETITTIKDLQKLYVKVYQMRAELLQVIFSSEDQVKLIDLPIASGMMRSMAENFQLQDEILTHLENLTDFTTASVKLKIGDFGHTIDAMAHHEAILYDEEMNKKFTNLKMRMKPLAAKMDSATRAIFTGKLIL